MRVLLQTCAEMELLMLSGGVLLVLILILFLAYWFWPGALLKAYNWYSHTAFNTLCRMFNSSIPSLSRAERHASANQKLLLLNNVEALVT